MHASPRPRPSFNPARITSLARLWLACVATLLTCAAHLLPPALRRRLPILDWPLFKLARFVANLIVICAADRAAPPKRVLVHHRRTKPRTGRLRAFVRAGVRRHLTNAHGALDLTAIARTCAHPERAIADMIDVLEHGLTRRAPILPRPASEALCSLAPIVSAPVCDSS